MVRRKKQGKRILSGETRRHGFFEGRSDKKGRARKPKKKTLPPGRTHPKDGCPRWVISEEGNAIMLNCLPLRKAARAI